MVDIKFSSCNLNDAYKRGNEIRQFVPSGAAGHLAVIISQNTPGVGSLFPITRELALLNTSIVVSGFTQYPQSLDAFAFTSIAPGVVTLQGSGLPGDPAGSLTFWTGKTPFGGKFVAAVGDGDFIVSGDSSLTLNQHSQGGLLLLENQGGTIMLSAFGGSGITEYQTGPREGWYVRTSQSSGEFVLIPNEQQVRAIIAEMISGVC